MLLVRVAPTLLLGYVWVEASLPRHLLLPSAFTVFNIIELLKKFPPRVIRTEKENEACTELLYELDRRSSKLTSAEKDLAELLTLLIEDFEDRHFQLPRAKPLEVLHFLMDQLGLLQKDLADVFGTPSIVSEVLSGKRDLNKDHIKRLSRRFHVSPELFF
jgi:HTH-type transcriptional regulator / antitoxin HigA